MFKKLVHFIKNLSIKNISYVVIFSFAFLYILYLLSYFPFDNVSSSGIGYVVYGNIKSLSIDFSLPMSHTSYPVGGYRFSGVPYLMLAALIVKIFGASVFVAYNITGTVFIFFSYLSFIYIIKRFTSNLLLGLILPIVFYSMPIIVGKAGYGTMMAAFAMLPLYFAIITLHYEYDRHIYKIMTVTMFVFALFLDGYSFVFIVLMAGIYSIITFIFKLDLENFKKMIFLGMSIIFAFFLYKISLPSLGAFKPMPLDFFRGQGVDLITLFIPDTRIYWVTDFISYGTKYNPMEFFTDGEMVYHSFLGYSVIFAVIISSIVLFFKKNHFKKSFFITLLVMFMASFILSLGPSLKINETKSVSNEKLSFKSYLMAEDQATMTMPHAKLFTKIPAINNMRAVHRWLLISKFSILLILSYLLSNLIKIYDNRWIKFAVYLLVILMIIEFAPNFKRKSLKFALNAKSFEFVDSKIVSKLKEQIPKKSVVAIYSSQNDYMANYICAESDIKCLNTGGDKNILLARKFWPKTFRMMRKNIDVLNNAYNTLKHSDVKYLILPKFNLRWDSYRNEISSVNLEEYSKRYSEFLRDKRFDYKNEEYYILLKLKNNKQGKIK